jgi:two-component sensor histidine kinase
MDMEDLHRNLRTGHVQAQGIVDTVADPLLVLNGDLCVVSASRAFFETFQVDSEETIGHPIYELGDGQWDIPELRRLLKDVIPKSTAIINYEVEHEFPTLGRKTMLLTARTLFHPDGVSRTMLLTIVDATDRHRRDIAKDMLFGELRHRMKNLMGVAQALARQTPTEGRSADEYRDDFLGRFSALIEAEDLAFSEQDDIGLNQLFERILAPFSSRPERVVITPGAAIELGPRTVIQLSLVIHELATNALKYGALSGPGGQVLISWQQEESNRLRLKWIERGGPPVVPPAKAGFGVKLIESAVTYGLSGAWEQEYAPEGYRSEFVIPLGAAHPSG